MLSNDSLSRRTNVLAFIAIMFFVIGENRHVTATENEKHSSSEEDENDDFFLLPHTKELGTAMICYRESLNGLEQLLLSNKVGVPFGGPDEAVPSGAEVLEPSPPMIAIWKDGTIIWSHGRHSKRKFYDGRLDADVIDRLEKTIAKLKRNAAKIESVDPMPTMSDVTSTIAILDGNRVIGLTSELDQMERLKKYWVFRDHRFVELAFNRTNFRGFCAELSGSHRKEIELYKTCRDYLIDQTPKNHRKSELISRIQWVVHQGREIGVNE